MWIRSSVDHQRFGFPDVLLFYFAISFHQPVRRWIADLRLRKQKLSHLRLGVVGSARAGYGHPLQSWHERRHGQVFGVLPMALAETLEAVMKLNQKGSILRVD